MKRRAGHGGCPPVLLPEGRRWHGDRDQASSLFGFPKLNAACIAYIVRCVHPAPHRLSD